MKTLSLVLMLLPCLVSAQPTITNNTINGLRWGEVRSNAARQIVIGYGETLLAGSDLVVRSLVAETETIYHFRDDMLVQVRWSELCLDDQTFLEKATAMLQRYDLKEHVLSEDSRNVLVRYYVSRKAGVVYKLVCVGHPDTSCSIMLEIYSIKHNQGFVLGILQKAGQSWR